MDKFEKKRGELPYQTPRPRGSSIKKRVSNKNVRQRLKREVPRPMLEIDYEKLCGDGRRPGDPILYVGALDRDED